MVIDMDKDIDGTSCYITQLSTELLFHIINYLPLESHFSFANACKRIYACSANVLKRHQEASTKYGVLSDRDPTTVPSMLRIVFSNDDPYPAFHVRSFEVWLDRLSWDDWKVIDDVYGYKGEEQKSWEYNEGEWESYLEPLEYGNGTSEDLELGRTQIEEGHDGILKAVLLANCPRLRDIKIISPGLDRVVEDRYTVSWLELFIGDAVRGTNPWPLGLKNLQSITVGVDLEPSNNLAPTTLWVDPLRYEHGSGPNNSSTDLLAHLLLLPSIESIYFGYYRDDPDNASDYSELLPACCSSVKHLFFQECQDLGQSFRELLLAAPKNLLSMSFSTVRSGNKLQHADLVVGGLGKFQGETLESLMFYGYGDDFRPLISPVASDFNSCDSNPFRPEIFQNFKALRHVLFDIKRIQVEVREQGREQGIDESDSAFLQKFFLDCFPKSIESINLWNTPLFGRNFWEFRDEMDLENAIIEMITSGRFKNLKSIFLEEVERARHKKLSNKDGVHKKRIWFRNAIKIGNEQGIDVHTITNRNAKLHKVDLPKPLDIYDFQTGPWGKRPTGWKFNVYYGEWCPPLRCSKCGNCEICFRNYTKELWNSIADA